MNNRKRRTPEEDLNLKIIEALQARYIEQITKNVKKALDESKKTGCPLTVLKM